MSDPQLLDTAVLDDLIAHIGADSARSIVDLFIVECRGLAANMGAADPDATRRAAHSLKSSAGQLGAMALSEAALAVESAAENGAATLSRLVAGLLDCAARTETALTARLAG